MGDAVKRLRVHFQHVRIALGSTRSVCRQRRVVKDAALAQEALAEALVQLREEEKGVPDLVHCTPGGELLWLLIAHNALEDEERPQLRHGSLCPGEAIAAVLGESGQELAPVQVEAGRVRVDLDGLAVAGRHRVRSIHFCVVVYRLRTVTWCLSSGWAKSCSCPGSLAAPLCALVPWLPSIDSGLYLVPPASLSTQRVCVRGDLLSSLPT